MTAHYIVRGGFYSPSRAVENLFWMGRYAERVESVGRLLRATALRLIESDPSSVAAVEVLTILCENARLSEMSPAAKPESGTRKKTKKVANHLTPRPLTYQRRRTHEVTIVPAPTYRREQTDAFGNPVTEIAIESAHSTLEIVARSLVEVGGREVPEPDKTSAWETVRDALAYRAGW
ncbi:MAG TPA: transglutaminase N-terminal domain-containing protein, partial [Terriglobales bacterium]|nr:transglutaminase N-terminal domain-containing protein [Terriglobales bacterium]